jgi:hypothetical protein
MNIPDIPFGTIDWGVVESIAHKEEKGMAHLRTRQFGDIRVRIVDYSAGYVANHWCEKAHVRLCLEGELHTELKDGRVEVLRPAVSYQFGDAWEPIAVIHPSFAELFIVD